MAGREGIEPPLPGPKPGVLPLDDLPTCSHRALTLSDKQIRQSSRDFFLEI